MKEKLSGFKTTTNNIAVDGSTRIAECRMKREADLDGLSAIDLFPKYCASIRLIRSAEKNGSCPKGVVPKVLPKKVIDA